MAGEMRSGGAEGDGRKYFEGGAGGDKAGRTTRRRKTQCTLIAFESTALDCTACSWATSADFAVSIKRSRISPETICEHHAHGTSRTSEIQACVHNVYSLSPFKCAPAVRTSPALPGPCWPLRHC